MNWKYGKNNLQEYYDCTSEDGTYLCVLRNLMEKQWIAFVGSKIILDKTRNDREKEKARERAGYFPITWILSSLDPQIMMQKAEYCYRHNQNEISSRGCKSHE